MTAVRYTSIKCKPPYQNGHAPSHAFGWAQKAIYAGSMVISLEAGYRGDAEDFQPERQLIRRLLYSSTGLSLFFFLSCTQLVCFLKKTVRSNFRLRSHFSENSVRRDISFVLLLLVVSMYALKTNAFCFAIA